MLSPEYAQQHQLAVIDCLEDPDDTLKLIADGPDMLQMLGDMLCDISLCHFAG
jgi:hypothetical protein